MTVLGQQFENLCSKIYLDAKDARPQTFKREVNFLSNVF